MWRHRRTKGNSVQPCRHCFGTDSPVRLERVLGRDEIRVGNRSSSETCCKTLARRGNLESRRRNLALILVANFTARRWGPVKNVDVSVPTRELPETINIHLTRRCNFGCRFCYAQFAECDFGRCQSIIMSYLKSRLLFSGMLRRKALVQVKRVAEIWLSNNLYLGPAYQADRR
jgi:hypothetical protein